MNSHQLMPRELAGALIVLVLVIAGAAGCSSGDEPAEKADDEKVPAECLEAIDAAHKRILTNDRSVEASLTYAGLVSSAYVAALTVDNDELAQVADEMEDTNETVAQLTAELKADGFDTKHSDCLDATNGGEDLAEACVTALDEIEENIRLTSDYVTKTSNLPVLVGEAADAGVTESESDDSDVLAELEDANAAAKLIKADIDDGEFSLFASKCRALIR